MMIGILFVLCCCLAAQAVESPFGATTTVTPASDALEVRVELTGPADGHFNAGMLRLEVPEGYTAEVVNLPAPEADELFEDGVYLPGTVLEYRVTPATPLPEMALQIQGCVDEMCYMPQSIALTSSRTAASHDSAPQAGAKWYEGFAREQVRFGYANAAEFAAWLASAVGDELVVVEHEALVHRVARHYGLWLGALLLIPLGLLLNLTPCVLPMIPITLAVLGTKSVGGGRRKGALLGLAYGGAMAVAYGLVGAVFVKVGGRFGGINASPWFNVAVGIVFVCLALSMFDVFLLDLTRFRGTTARPHGTYLSAAFLGGLTALLAGACVAPVLVWVLLWSAELYGGGNALGLWLPLFLGVGLGLPWPFLGAGLGFLPKPGAWMVRVKQGFGVLILLFACYYFWNAYQLWRPSQAMPIADDDYWQIEIETAVAEAQAFQQPLFIDFWGVTCKACDTMDATTLRDPLVRGYLDRMTRLKIQADDFDDPEIAPLLRHFNIPGLPAYVVMVP
ncbi:MAG: thioredoxin family protein [Victivallales bacterium]|nr:thioredoxin family protein [Victivallales bacterium]